MRRLALISILLISVLAIGSSTIAQSPANNLQNRLVVFEAFMNPAWGHCQTAGPVVDQLANEYAAAGKPVVFLEQYVFDPLGNRYSRWWAAHGGGTVGFPMVMVDSGNQISDRSVSSDYYNTYKAMVDAALARPPKAEIQVQSQRIGNKLRFDVQLKNLSGVALSSSNSATVNAIVYEDAHVGVTDRYVRAVVSTAIAPDLADGATGTFTLETDELSGVDWDKIHPIVLADYRPGASGAYDMLQAALVQPTGSKIYLPIIVKNY